MPDAATPTPDDPGGKSPPPIFDADGALSRAFLLERGYCCGLGCRNCPYPRDERAADDATDT